MKPRWWAARARGQTLALAAVVMVGMVGLLALAVDTGLFLETRRELQNAADAGALAGIGKLTFDTGGNLDPDSAAAARDYANAIALANADVVAGRLCEDGTLTSTATTSTLAVSGGVVHTLNVQPDCTTAYSLGRILGLTTVYVNATATAALGSLQTSGCPLPVGVLDANGATPGYGYVFGDLVALKVTDGSSGNFHLLSLDGSSASGSVISDEMAGKQCVPVSMGMGSGSTTAPGGKLGQLQSGLEARGLTDCGTNSGGSPLCSVTVSWTDTSVVPNVGYSLPYTLACPDTFADLTELNAQGQPITRPGEEQNLCFAVVPVVRSWDISGNKPIDVAGFARFYVEGYIKNGNDHFLFGRFLAPSPVPGPVGAYQVGTITADRLIH